MSEDMSDVIKKMNDMLKNNQIPDSIKNMMNNFANGNSNCNDTSSKNSNCNSPREDAHSTSNNETINDFDINTMLKMKSVIENMNKGTDDPRANLLRSLKPYLKASRKEKVDQYIKLFNIGKMIEVFNPFGGDKKNDV